MFCHYNISIKFLRMYSWNIQYYQSQFYYLHDTTVAINHKSYFYYFVRINTYSIVISSYISNLFCMYVKIDKTRNFFCCKVKNLSRQYIQIYGDCQDAYGAISIQDHKENSSFCNLCRSLMEIPRLYYIIMYITV